MIDRLRGIGGDRIAVRRAPLPWWLAGLLLGLVQVASVATMRPLGVSTQFVVVEARAAELAAPDYTRTHALIGSEKYQTLGYEWWLVVGLMAGACAAALATRKWRVARTTVWWQTNWGNAVTGRFVACFAGGFLILLGARFAQGCTSGQFASGWAQLSLSAIPFTIAMFAFGMLTAYVVYRKTPKIEE